jgi:uncharacterized membrane-anchored protein YhcB (DUF1043 family)
MNNITSMDWFLYIVIALVIGIVIGYFILRWVFQVEKTIKMQRRQITLLKMIAIKLGVPEKDIPVDNF